MAWPEERVGKNMEKKLEIIYENIIENVSDGLLVVDLDGTILHVNPSAADILGIKAGLLLEKKIAGVMLEWEENDEFFQCLLDAVYSKETQVSLVSYRHEGVTKRLRVVSSFLTENGEKVGLVVTFSDLTELMQLSDRNALLNKKLTGFLDRFVEVMIGAIEARTPYNANHTKSMVRYATRYLDWRESKGDVRAGKIREPFLASVWLHDVGKLVVPRSVMDKATRLGAREKDVRYRIEAGILCEKLRMAENPALKKEATEKIRMLTEAAELIEALDQASYVDDASLDKLTALRDARCLGADGNERKLLEQEEFEALSVRRGTLTGAERKIIESHVVHTREMLDKMGFEDKYEKVSKWAGDHHEYLNGTGYPAGLKAEDITWESRLLTIIDIYDSLTADDRPYKPAMAPQKAFAILESMCNEGKLDGEILRDFYDSGAWKKDPGQ